ncbi:MAG: VWA domain-containing protein [Myxococcales bacterium]|nr:VWA domain-containing protein [Myxococcales bacterium]
MKPIITLLMFILAAAITVAVYEISSFKGSDSSHLSASIANTVLSSTSTPVTQSTENMASTTSTVRSQTSTVVTRSAPTDEAGDAPIIQLALLLDTSNSMDGLIDQARSQLWRIVEELSRATYKGQDPLLQVALFSYGNDGYSLRSGYIRQDLPFTEDLDAVSAALFGLSTDGGSEYAGMVLKAALTKLRWAGESGAMKLMYIAGNEAFTQGPEAPLPVIGHASAQNIKVHPIFCGSEAIADAESWRKGAEKSGVAFLTIDQDKKPLHVDAPQDSELVELGQQLNTTYIPMGERGQQAAVNQQAQDNNASLYGRSGAAKRSIAKSSKYYRAARWDLVDAVDEGRVQLSEVAVEKLPKVMRAMTPQKRVEYVNRQRAKRHRIKARIKELSEARSKYVVDERKRHNKMDAASLDEVIVGGMHRQAAEVGFEFR